MKETELIQAIIDAWIKEDYDRAIALTLAFQASQKNKRCLKCNKPLAAQAKGNYCKRHRHLSEGRKAQVKKYK